RWNGSTCGMLCRSSRRPNRDSRCVSQCAASSATTSERIVKGVAMAKWWQAPWLGTSWRTRKATGALAEYYDVPRAKEDQPIGEAPLLAVDVETTGIDPKKDLILSIGWVPVTGGPIPPAKAVYAVIHHDAEVVERVPAGMGAAKIHGITHTDIEAGEPLRDVLSRLLLALRGRAMVVHFSPIETQFLGQACRQ